MFDHGFVIVAPYSEDGARVNPIANSTDVSRERMRLHLKPRFVVPVGAAVVLLSVFFARGMAAQAGTMVGALSRLQPDMIGIAALLSIVGILLSGVEWWRLIRLLGYKVTYRAALTAYLSAGLAGYVVNSVGPAIGTAVSLRGHGVSPGRAALLTIMANALGFCGILVWAPIGIVLLSQTGMDRTLPMIGPYGPAAAALVQIVAATVMVLVIHGLASVAGSRNRFARRLLGRVPTSQDDSPLPLKGRQILGLVPWSALSWLGGVGALYVVLAAMSPGIGLNVGAVVGSAALASTLGSLAFFVPEGLGVSDSTLVILLTHATGLPPTTCVAAALAVRTLDPITKLSLLGGLALFARPSATRRLGRLIPHESVASPSAG
jgi:glycosyltransferase 2 family protein